jgi:hypothetical protein
MWKVNEGFVADVSIDLCIFYGLCSDIANKVVGERSTLHSGHISPGERAPGTHSVGKGVGGPQDWPGQCGEEKILLLLGLKLLLLSHPAHKPVTLPTALSWLLLHMY